MPSPSKLSLATPNQPAANPKTPLPGYGNLPSFIRSLGLVRWHPPLTYVQYAETQAADRAALFASRAYCADAAPP